jgi:hypothetical protein
MEEKSIEQKKKEKLAKKKKNLEKFLESQKDKMEVQFDGA